MHLIKFANLYFSKFCILSIKFNYAAPLSLLNLVQKLLHPSASSIDTLIFFCLVFWTFDCLPFVPFVHEKFLILWNVTPGFCFEAAFHCCLLISTQHFELFLMVEVFTHLIAKNKAIACIWKFFKLVVFSYLYTYWNIFFRIHCEIFLLDYFQVPATHIGQNYSAKTCNGSHPLNVFAEQPILNAWKGSECQKHCQISQKGSNQHSVWL